MSQLIDKLKSFNRKERYWLINKALGDGASRLDAEFVDELTKILGENVPCDAWWAMDYHIDWIFATLLSLEENKDCYCNDFGYITSTQEDVDFIVAFDNKIILIEAKWDGSWSQSQIGNKLERLGEIKKIAEKLNISVFGVLSSPRKPQKLNASDSLFWNVKSKDYSFVCLKPSLDDINFNKVTRCDGQGIKNSNGKFWMVEKVII